MSYYFASAPVARDLEKVDEPITGVSTNLIEERIRSNLEPLNEQISTLTKFLNHKIIHKNIVVEPV